MVISIRVVVMMVVAFVCVMSTPHPSNKVVEGGKLPPFGREFKTTEGGMPDVSARKAARLEKAEKAKEEKLEAMREEKAKRVEKEKEKKKFAAKRVEEAKAEAKRVEIAKVERKRLERAKSEGKKMKKGEYSVYKRMKKGEPLKFATKDRKRLSKMDNKEGIQYKADGLWEKAKHAGFDRAELAKFKGKLDSLTKEEMKLLEMKLETARVTNRNGKKAMKAERLDRLKTLYKGTSKRRSKLMDLIKRKKMSKKSID